MAVSDREEGVFLPLTGRMVYPEDDRVLRFLREGWFEYIELTMMSRLVRAGDYFVDVGAHCGLYSKLAAHRMKGAGTIVAVEPNPALHPFIRKNLGIVHVPTDGAVKVGESNLVCGAVATATDTALLQVGDSGWTAYSTLNTASNPHLTQSIPVATYTLESLIVAAKADRQIIVKLDTEGLEYEILEHAAPLLARRNDIHLMIEFDENNLAAGNHSTSALVELVEGMGYTLAKFDRQTERLVPFATRGPLWGANLVATKDLGVLNARLSKLEKVVVAETEDFLRRGEVAEQIYKNSENLGKTVKSSMEMAMKIAGTTSVLEGSPEIEEQVAARLASARERPEAELPSAVVDLLTDELARLAGTAHGVAKQLDSTRKAMHRAREEISQLDARLADQHRVVVSARAEIVGDNGGVGEGAMPATTSEDGEVGHALKLTERMSDDIGMLIGAARWLAKEAAQADEARAEARRLIGELNDARGEIHRLNKRVERERKRSKRLATELGEKTRALDSLARLRDEVEAAGGQAAEVEAGRSENERLATELDKKRQALDSLSRPEE